jgi:hypothetical protein
MTLNNLAVRRAAVKVTKLAVKVIGINWELGSVYSKRDHYLCVTPHF